MTRIAVMGSGSWGTAFALVLADAGNDVVMWGRDAGLAESISTAHENPRYHPGIVLPDSMRGTTDPADALDGAEIVVLAVPAQSLRDNLGSWRDLLADGSLLVSLMKGIEQGTTRRMSEVAAEVAGVDPARVAVVVRPQPRARDRRAPAGGHHGRVHRRRRGAAHRRRVHDGVLPALLEHRRRRHRDRRLGQERDRPRQRHGGRHGVRRERAVGAHHARPRGDDAAGHRPRGLAADVPRPGRHRRPRRHLPVAAVAQPLVRRAPRSWSDARRGHRGHHADLRGREELPLDPRAGAAPTASTCPSPSRWWGSCTPGSTRARCSARS